MSWVNFDGLEVKFNRERAEAPVDGVTNAKERMLVVDLPDATALTDTDTAAVAGDTAFIPAGSIITKAVFVADTAFTTSASGTLDIGFKQAAGTNIDDDGIDQAVAAAALAIRQGVICDGAMIGDKLQYDSYVMFTYDTGAFTAGAGRLFVSYIV